MGLFFNNYNRPGPGVSKDEPKKKGIALYFQLFFRHFWDFIKENFMFVITSIPMLVIYYMGFSIHGMSLMQQISADTDYLTAYETLKIFFVIITVILIGSGPSSAAMAYMMRCITRERHCFLWSDFFEKFKENFKNGILISVLDALVIMVFLPVAIKFYYTQYISTSSAAWFALLIVMIMFSVVYIMIHNYFYQFIVTFELSFRNAMKNSLIMAIAYLPLNIALILIPVILTYILVSYITLPFVVLILLICWATFMRYPIEFAASRVIDRKLLSKNEENKEKEENN